MSEETTPNTESTKAKAAPAAKKPAAPALEDKPFTEFMEQHFTPSLQKALLEYGLSDLHLSFTKAKLPVPNSAETYWQVVGSWGKGQRQFNLYFLEDNINGKKAFSASTNGNKPSIIESFMIDERKSTLDLMVMYTLQRLNGQKWLARN